MNYKWIFLLPSLFLVSCASISNNSPQAQSSEQSRELAGKHPVQVQQISNLKNKITQITSQIHKKKKMAIDYRNQEAFPYQIRQIEMEIQKLNFAKKRAENELNELNKGSYN